MKSKFDPLRRRPSGRLHVRVMKVAVLNQVGRLYWPLNEDLRLLSCVSLFWFQRYTVIERAMVNGKIVGREPGNDGMD
jgi:hypothetical protein